MYCQSCGAEIQPGLNYCNRRGAQVTSLASAQQLGPASPTTGPMHSVADHTTRALEHARREPRA